MAQVEPRSLYGRLLGGTKIGMQFYEKYFHIYKFLIITTYECTIKASKFFQEKY